MYRRDGFFWYSRKQHQIIMKMRNSLWKDGVYSPNYCNIGGVIHHYTEKMSGKYLRHKSNFPDAICLGYGFWTKKPGKG